VTALLTNAHSALASLQADGGRSGSTLRNASTALPLISAIELKNPEFKRFFGHYAIDYIIENGHPKALTSFFDLSPSLES
jgi:hypothetical protein